MTAVAGSKNQILLESDLPTGLYDKDEVIYNEIEENAYLIKVIQDNGINAIDLHDALNQITNAGNLPFYRTDHHWNCYGAFAAYKCLTNFYYEHNIIETTPLNEEDFWTYTDPNLFFGSYLRKFGGRIGDQEGEYVSQYLPYGDYSLEATVEGYYEPRSGTSEIFIIKDKYKNNKDKYQNYYNVLIGGYGMKPILTNNNNLNGKVLLVLGDSYSQALIPMLIANFYRIYFLDVRSFEESISQYALNINADSVLLLCGELAPNRFKYLNP